MKDGCRHRNCRGFCIVMFVWTGNRRQPERLPGERSLLAKPQAVACRLRGTNSLYLPHLPPASSSLHRSTRWIARIRVVCHVSSSPYTRAVLILLTNDDGIRAPGILAMYRELTKLGEVHVVAPETVQSATGHGITLDTPLLTQRVTIENGFTGVAIGGRPADCVKVAVSQILPRRPDLVVSGMNSGANVGINVLYSGTVAAAIEAAFLGLPSIAVSLHLKSEVPLDFAQAGTVREAGHRANRRCGIEGRSMRQHQPAAAASGREPGRCARRGQCVNPWTDEYERRQDPRRARVLLEQQRLHARQDGRRHRRRQTARQIRDGDAVAVRHDRPHPRPRVGAAERGTCRENDGKKREGAAPMRSGDVRGGNRAMIVLPTNGRVGASIRLS